MTELDLLNALQLVETLKELLTTQLERLGA
jgi:hypothetical protein